MSQVSWNRQLALPTGLFVLGSLAYWLEFKHKPQKEAQEEQSKKMFAIKDTPVKAISLATPTQTFSFSCADYNNKLCKPGDHSKWDLLEPAKIRADDSNTNALLTTLST